MSAAQSVLSSIQHYQKSIHKSHGNSERVLHCINRLYGLPVTVQHLQDTGVGKTINSLRKSEGEVGEAAKALVLKWKQMVAEESENEQEGVTDRNAHSSHNGGTRNGNDREKSDKRSKGYSEKTSKSHDLKDPTQMDDNKNNKRKRESDSEQEKRHKLENNSAQSTRDPISSSLSRANFNGDNVLDEDWNDPHNDEEMHSEDENGVSNDEVKTGTISFEERNAQSSDDDFNRNEYATNSSEKSWHRSEDFTAHQQNKSSKSENKSKSKKSSSRSDKSKCSSSLRDESKGSVSSNSTRQRDDKSSSGSGSHSNRKDVSNYSEKSEGKSKSKEKNKKGKHKDKHRSKDEKESKDTREKGKRSLEEDEDGVDSFSGKSFGEALGMMFPPEKSRKKSSSGSLLSVPSASKTNKSKSSSSAEKLSPKVGIHSSPKIEHKESPVSKVMSLEVDEDFGLPALNPNYKPLPQPNFFNSPPKRYQNEDEDDLSNIMYSKVQRTKVYSGIKTGYTFVPSLFDLCTRVLQENIDALEYTGGVPFDLLKPVLERANPDQLFTLEHFNPYLIEDTDTFWEYHCKKDFRTTKREEMETWRDMYLRCRDERENKLKSVTANIAAAAKAKALPVRKTQIAFVEGTVKPPRNVARKQAKFGTAHSTSSSPPSTKQSGAGLSSSFTGRSSAAPPSVPLVSVPAPRGSGSGSQSSSCKPKAKAPLMQKTLQFMKLNRFGKR